MTGGSIARRRSGRARDSTRSRRGSHASVRPQPVTTAHAATCSHCAFDKKEGLETAEVLRALDGEVAGLDLVADLEGTTRSPASTVDHAVAADERLQRRWRQVERHLVRRPALKGDRGAVPTDGHTCAR